MNFICVTYDPFDNYVFDFCVFAEKASAKSYARKKRKHSNFDISVGKTDAKYPLNKTIDSGLCWKRFVAERDAEYRAILHN